jgi:hypothetical protein
MKKVMLVFLFVGFFFIDSSAYTISRSLSWGSSPASWSVDYYAPNGASVFVLAGVNRYCAQASILGYHSNGVMKQIGTNYQGAGATWPSTAANPLVRFVIQLTNPNSCSGPDGNNNPTMGQVTV